MASQDYGSVLLEFDISFDKDKVLADVREKVDLAKSEFPSDAEEPMVLEFNMATMPVMTVSLSGKVPDRTLIYHAKELQNEIERIPGILEAPITGDREELLEILVSPTKLENYDVSLANLIRSITGNNRIVAAGSIDKGQGKFSVKVPAVYESAQDVYNIGIITKGEGTVKLGDIAEIRSTFKENTSYARIDGKPAIHLDIKKRIESCKNLQDVEGIRLEYLGKKGLIPSEMKLLGKLPIDQKKIKGQELNKLKNWPEKVKLMQKNWIGKSYGLSLIHI